MSFVLECLAWFGGATVLTTVSHLYLPKVVAWAKTKKTESSGPS